MELTTSMLIALLVTTVALSETHPAKGFKMGTLGGFGEGMVEYVCLKRVDYDNMIRAATAGRKIDIRQRRMGPEIIFDVE